MLNGAPLNAAPLGGSIGQEAPSYVVRGQAFVWRLRVLVDGVDLTAQLTGAVDIDREEGAAGVAGFDLYLPDSPVVPPDWIGRAVTIDYLSSAAGVASEDRRYSGRISSAAWSPTTRLLSIECSDRLQQRVEAMSVAAVDALVGGYWSADVHEAVDGRSRWDYALERLATRGASLEASPTGALRVTSWYAAQPHFVFGSGTTLYQSVALDQPGSDSITNRIELEISYRYSRLWQRNQRYTWLVPAGSFCNWRDDSHELPTVGEIEDASSNGGQTLLNPAYVYLPASAPDPCGDGQPWINSNADLLLSAAWTGARRWTQTVTETYTLTLATPAGEVDGTQVVQRQSGSLQIEADRVEAWTEDEITGGASGYEDVHDEARRGAALDVLLRTAQTEIVAAHRKTTLSWQVPTSLALGVDLIHTLELDDQGARARGKCCRVVDAFDLQSGEAVTTISIAVMRGGGTSDPLTLPARIGASPVDPGVQPDVALPSQIGGLSTSPPYDDEREGFSGNYSAIDNNVGQEPYPRRMDANAREIAADVRDELVLTSSTLYRVGIPNDLLEL